MTSRIDIRRLSFTDWQTYRQLRLAALRESPDAFGSRYVDARQYDDEHWRSRLKDASFELHQPLAAWVIGEPVALAWAEIEPPDVKTAHLFQMWVNPGSRGQGIGVALVQSAIEWAKSRGAVCMVLEVTVGDRPARRLYDQMGFSAVGDPVSQRPGAPLMEQAMVLAFQ